ncbi:MAG: hypothetical protein AB8B80_00670 [Marinicellaceae bacterium]
MKSKAIHHEAHEEHEGKLKTTAQPLLLPFSFSILSSSCLTWESKI